MRQSRRDLLGTLGALPLLGWHNAHARALPEYKYRDTGSMWRRDDYQAKLLALALDKTVPSHGPYRLSRVTVDSPPRRLAQQVDEGRLINVLVGPAVMRGVGAGPIPLRPIHFSVLDRLLGYRRLIIRREDLDRFAAVQTVAQLRHLRAGQGHDWLDARILRHNGFRVDDSGALENLLPMLSSKRFDYVALSIIEVDSLLQRHPDLASGLAIAPGIAIEYSLPSIFYVSNKFPEMAERLGQGLLMAKRDGSFARLFDATFGQELRVINAKGVRDFQIVNPFLQVA